MKKCALLLMFCLSLNSCDKSIGLPEVQAPEDKKLEAIIKEDFQFLASTIGNFFSQLKPKEIPAVREKLSLIIHLEELDNYFIAHEFRNYEARIFNNLKRLSYHDDANKLNTFIREISRTSENENSKLQKAYLETAGTPCYDRWDIDMAAASATYLTCIISSASWQTKSRCGVVAAIMAVAAEVKYQQCIEHTY